MNLDMFKNGHRSLEVIMKTQFPVLISLLNLNDRDLLSYMYMYRI